eukprot:PLAT14701.1.p1 GENE.PLAT14701.1~~PLAT14701.1.p1  ORF type:complete len:737 (-),score=361.93 PLAT14701.1:143-2170(-)
MVDVLLGFLSFWAVGYGIAFGDSRSGWSGSSHFFLSDSSRFPAAFLQSCLATTSATIVSGSLAERTRYESYVTFTLTTMSFTYPLLAHWVWSPTGWLSPTAASPVAGVGFVDFAGSAVVHVMGGLSGLVGAIIVGPRADFIDLESGRVRRISGQSLTQTAAGVLLLWFGFYSFNCASTQTVTASAAAVGTAALVAQTTTMAAVGSILCVYALLAASRRRNRRRQMDMAMLLNAPLAGLVAICASAAVVDGASALLIGAVAGAVYLAASRALLAWKVDDPLDAAPVHAACGAWGVLAVGLFSRAPHAPGLFFGGDGSQMAAQLLGLLVVSVWALATSAAGFYVIKCLLGLRVARYMESVGLNVEFGDVDLTLRESELMVLLSDPAHPMLEGFHEYLAQQHADEQLDFLVAVALFDRMLEATADDDMDDDDSAEADAQVRELAKAIYNRYVRSSAPKEANLSMETRRSVRGRLALGVLPALFDGARLEVMTMLVTEPFMRYFQRYVEMHASAAERASFEAGGSLVAGSLSASTRPPATGLLARCRSCCRSRSRQQRPRGATDGEDGEDGAEPGDSARRADGLPPMAAAAAAAGRPARGSVKRPPSTARSTSSPRRKTSLHPRTLSRMATQRVRERRRRQTAGWRAIRSIVPSSHYVYVDRRTAECVWKWEVRRARRR